MTLPEAYVTPGRTSLLYQMSNPAMDAMSAAIKTIAVEEKLTVIDLRAVTANRRDCFAADGIHTNAAGAALIAQTVFQALKQEIL